MFSTIYGKEFLHLKRPCSNNLQGQSMFRAGYIALWRCPFTAFFRADKQFFQYSHREIFKAAWSSKCRHTAPPVTISPTHITLWSNFFCLFFRVCLISGDNWSDIAVLLCSQNLEIHNTSAFCITNVYLMLTVQMCFILPASCKSMFIPVNMGQIKIVLRARNCGINFLFMQRKYLVIRWKFYPYHFNRIVYLIEMIRLFICPTASFQLSEGRYQLAGGWICSQPFSIPHTTSRFPHIAPVLLQVDKVTILLPTDISSSAWYTACSCKKRITS